MVRIGIPRESQTGVALVAATPRTARQLADLGYDVVVETGAGQRADAPDRAYLEAGVAVADAADIWSCDIVVKVDPPTLEQVTLLRPGATVVSLMTPARNPDLVQALVAGEVTGLAMDAVPRISRAQSMDVLSSMANVAGYRAVVEAAHAFGRQFTGQVTAAGKVPPASVFVVGAGVAGLAAIGAARSMGAVVRAFDVRPEVGEQVESMGAEFVSVEMDREVSTDGYAKEMTPEQVRATAAMYDAEVRGADIVITTALIPGRPAPMLVTAESVAGMAHGSVIVDMAAANGGNCAVTEPGQITVTSNRVSVVGYTDLAGRMAAQTSQLYGTNVVNLAKLMTPGKQGELVLDLDDVIVRGITVATGGKTMWPPPAVQVSATPKPVAAAPAEPRIEKAPRSPVSRWAAMVVALVVFFLVTANAPAPVPEHFTVLMLAVVIGYYVIGKVHHALHTPLMSVTNAISGIIVVGAMLQIGLDDPVVVTLSFVAILLASINVFGGFAVTRRMLRMFSKG